MPDVSTVQIAAGTLGHGSKHNAKSGMMLPIAAEDFFQVLSARLDTGVADGPDAVFLSDPAGAVVGVDKTKPKADGALIDAVLPPNDSPIADSGNVTVPAQFSVDTFSAISVVGVGKTKPKADGALIDAVSQPNDSPLADSGNAAVLARFSADAFNAISAQTPSQGTKGGGEVAQQTVVAGISVLTSTEDDVLASSLTPPQAKRVGRSEAATPAVRGQLLPLTDHVSNVSKPDPGLVGEQIKDVRMDVALAQFGQQGKGEGAAVLPQQSGAVAASQADLTVMRPFDHLLRPTEAKLNVAVDAPVRSAGFPAEFSEKVVWLVGRQGQLAELSLNPPHLGSVDVRLSMIGGEVGAQFYSPHPGVREAMEAALPKLRELMAEAGIALGQASVRDEGFTQREGAQANAQSTRNLGGGEFGQGQQGDLVVEAIRSGQGLVDLYI